MLKDLNPKRYVRWSPAARSTLLSVLALGTVWLVFFWRYFAPVSMRVTFPAGDFTYQFFVFRDIAYRALAAGHLPLWADCIYGGYPFQADPQSQLFYPPIWLSFATLKLMGWGNFPLIALTIETTAHYFVASLFTFLFLRDELRRFGAPASQVVSNVAALLGAVVFVYGGYLTGYPPLQTAILETVTWLPLSLWLLARLADTVPGNRVWLINALAATLSLAIAFFAGHPQTFLFVFYLAITYFVFRARAGALPWQTVGQRLLVVLVLVGGLSLVQILPQVQYFLQSSRTSLTFAELSGGFPAGILAQLFITDPVWSPMYVGLLPLALALLAVASYRHGSIVFWATTAVVGYILSLGGSTPLYSMAYWLLPGYRLFRDQERLVLVVSFALAVLATHGTAALLADFRRSPRGLAIIGLLALAAGGVGQLSYSPGLIGWLPRAETMAVAVGIMAAGFLLARVSAIPPVTLGGVLVGLTAINLLMTRSTSNTVSDFDPYPFQPILDPVINDPTPFFRVQDDARMQGHFACGYGLAEWSGITPIRPASWSLFDAQARESLRWKLLGVKYLITWKNGAITREGDLPPAQKVAQGAAPEGEAKVYMLFDIPRRAWLVHRVSGAADPAHVIESVSAAEFDPFVTGVVQTQDLNGVVDEGSGASSERVEVAEDWPGHLVLNVSASSQAFLLVSEAYYPGWVAAVDGQTRSVVLADGYVQGVWVPAGTSTVKLDFAPSLLIAGAFGSGLTAAAIVVLVAFSIPVNRKHSVPVAQGTNGE